MMPAAAIRFFDGKHPRFTQVPPSVRFSVIAAVLPSSAALMAAANAVDPEPKITRSNFCVCIDAPDCVVNPQDDRSSRCADLCRRRPLLDELSVEVEQRRGDEQSNAHIRKRPGHKHTDQEQRSTG